MNTVLETTNIYGPPGLSFDLPNLSHRKQARQTAARDRPDDPGILFGILILRIYLEGMDSIIMFICLDNSVWNGGKPRWYLGIEYIEWNLHMGFLGSTWVYCFNTGLNRRLRQTLNPRFARGVPRRWGAAPAMEQGRTTPDLEPQTWNRWFPPFLETNVL